MLTYIILSNTGVGPAILACIGIIVAFGIFAYVWTSVLETKDAVESGGIKSKYPETIKFIMQTYPNAVVTLDTSLCMKIVSKDTDNDVTMSFSLKLNPISKVLNVTGEIIPGNTKWAWIPSKKYKWKVVTNNAENFCSEQRVIKEMKSDMIFNP